MSGATSWTSLSTPRDPSFRTSACVARLVGANPTNSQNAASHSHLKRKKTTDGARSLTSTNARPIARSPSSTTTSTDASSVRNWSDSVRAGRSCPSPTLAVRMSTRVIARLYKAGWLLV